MDSTNQSSLELRAGSVHDEFTRGMHIEVLFQEVIYFLWICNML